MDAAPYGFKYLPRNERPATLHKQNAKCYTFDILKTSWQPGRNILSVEGQIPVA